MKILFIHGANSTPTSFNFLIYMLKPSNYELISYSMDETLDGLLSRIISKIERDNEDVIIIGHSLGGVIGCILAQSSYFVKNCITIASPIRGLKILYGIYKSDLINKLLFNSFNILMLGHKERYKCDVTSFVTIEGNNPLLFAPNDGVISIESQEPYYFFDKIKINKNHFEVLQDYDVVLKLSQILGDKIYEV